MSSKATCLTFHVGLVIDVGEVRHLPRVLLVVVVGVVGVMGRGYALRVWGGGAVVEVHLDRKEDMEQ